MCAVEVAKANRCARACTAHAHSCVCELSLKNLMMSTTSRLWQKVVYIYCHFPGSHGWFDGSQNSSIITKVAFSCRFDAAPVSQPVVCHPCMYLITNLSQIRRLFCSLAISACCYCNYGARFQRGRHCVKLGIITGV